MRKEAKFWKTIKNKTVQCQLCAHNCKIADGKRGICRVRENEDGRLYTLIYSSCSSLAVDPIEKKPLYHFYPGTDCLSLGTSGCNFQCLHCQNSEISAARPEDLHMREISPEAAVAIAKERNCRGISWTYNEPTIWYEYSYDSAKLAKKVGLYTVYVTNGFINEDPLREISPYLDAMNVDVKAFTEEFYKKICKAKLKPVLQTCELAKERNIHLEVTYLVIPKHNDSLDEVRKFLSWVVKKLGNETPVHFSRFHPDHKMLDVPATPFETLLKIYDMAKDIGVLYPYIGNVPHGEYDNTKCPYCGNICVERHGYVTQITGVRDGKCTKCGKNIPITV